MREFSTYIKEALVNGLRPEKNSLKTSFFADMFNLVPDQMGARAYEAIESVGDIENDYPFPQWFDFLKVQLILASGALYSADDAFVPFDLTELLDITATDLTLLTSPMRGVDYGGNWMLLNAQGSIYSYNGTIRASTQLQANALTQYKNRTIIGGSPNGMWTEVWIDRLKSILSNNLATPFPYTLPLGQNFLLYSSFDSSDFPFALLHPEILLTGTENAFKESELFFANEFGFIEMPFHGAILDMISSLDQLFVFGEDGIISLNMATDAPGATLAITGNQPFGIKQRGAVGGNDAAIVFIDSFDQLWKIDSRGLTKLGFAEYMTQLSGYIWITRDPDEDIFYIGDSAKSFILKNNRLARIYQTVSHVSGESDDRLGISFDTGATTARLESERLDIGIPALKTLTGIFIASDDEFTATYQAKADVTTKRISSKVVPANYEGYGAVRLFGKNHTIEIDFAAFQLLQISHIELKWQIDDSRHTRGVFLTEDASGAG